MLVVDASVAVSATLGPPGFAELGDSELVAPALMWFETHSALHELVWRGDITEEAASKARALLDAAPVRRVDHRDLADEAWRVADELGWAKTYDAEYVALGRLLGCRVVTLDARLSRGTERLGFVVSPTEL